MRGGYIFYDGWMRGLKFVNGNDDDTIRFLLAFADGDYPSEKVFREMFREQLKEQHIKLDDPLCIEHVYDREYCGSPILLNRMFDELKTYALARVERSEDAANPYKLEKSEKWPYVLERREDGRT